MLYKLTPVLRYHAVTNQYCYILCMDRTNWRYDNNGVNYLMVSVIWKNMSIPIVWTCLKKYGDNLNTKNELR